MLTTSFSFIIRVPNVEDSAGMIAPPVLMIIQSGWYRFIFALISSVHMDAIDHCQTTRSILRNEADKAGITKDKLMIPVYVEK